MKESHVKSDIDITLRPEGFPEGFRDLAAIDFTLTLTSGAPRPYAAKLVVTQRDGALSGATLNHDGSLRIAAPNPGLTVGELWVEITAQLPDEGHADGFRKVVWSAPTGVSLVAVGPDTTALTGNEVSIALPIFRGEKGDRGEDGYTPIKGVDYWTAEDVAEYAKTTEANTWSAEQSFANITVAGNIYQAGENYVTHATEVRTENDIITLREGAEWGLGVGQHAGLVARKYDGETDGVLVFGADGVARVGDQGDAQPLATREEVVADGAMFVWDAANYRLKSFAPRIVEMEVTYEDDTTETFNVICQPANAAEE